MRRCCCCVSVHWGAGFLGLLALVLVGLELAVLVPYLADLDGFNPVRDNLKHFTYIFDSLLEEHGLEPEAKEEALDFVHRWLWTTMLVEASLSAAYALVALLMVLGVGLKRRGLMLPYLIIQMAIIVCFILFAALMCVGLFFVSVVMGTIAVGVAVIAAFFFIYFWVAVQKSYKELGNRDYMYSPAPVKPIYNPRDGSPRYNYYDKAPTAPQQFNME